MLARFPLHRPLLLQGTDFPESGNRSILATEMVKVDPKKGRTMSRAEMACEATEDSAGTYEELLISESPAVPLIAVVDDDESVREFAGRPRLRARLSRFRESQSRDRKEAGFDTAC